MSTFYIIRDEDDLTHHGIKGQKWGVRRFQNSDGTYTTEGKKRRATKQDIDTYEEMVSDVNVEFSREAPKLYKKATNDIERMMGMMEFMEILDPKEKPDLYKKIYVEQLDKKYSKYVLSFFNNHKKFQEAQEFASQFRRSSYSGSMKYYADYIDELNKKISDENKEKKS